MKTTIEIPDELLREASAQAARQGRSLEEVFMEALKGHLSRSAETEPGQEAWRVVFGKGNLTAVREVDEAVANDLGQIESESWS